LTEPKRKTKKITFFGNFGQGNLGNESTLQAILFNLRQHLPDAEVSCICTGPEATVETHKITAVPMHELFIKPELLQNNPLTRFLLKVFIGIPIELYRWVKAFRTLKGTDMLIVPGTGLLSDAYGLFGFAPFGIFKYSLIAKLCRCKLLFVSVGAGPIYRALGRCLTKSALSLADFRSYRDNSTMKYLQGIGFPTNNDRVYPDLAFSLPDAVIPHDDVQEGARPVVGVGLMDYAGRYSVDKPSNTIYLAYLEKLAIFAGWLIMHGYDVRLLIGDLRYDKSVVREFKDVLKSHGHMHDERRIIDEEVSSVEQLLSQLAATDVVVATRFHNVLFSLICKKPVIAISFHHKCASLMSAMGLSAYCQDINHLNADKLIEQFCDLEKNAEKVRIMIRKKTEEFRRALEEQYTVVFNDV
jgi:polysaccharide pyruvyl transferase WcaK-like protein